MDTSDELNKSCIMVSKQNVDIIPDSETTGKEENARGPVKITAQQNADQAIRDAESAKATMFNVPGEFMANLGRLNANATLIDQDYQMIDSHIDENLRKKIVNFEFVKFSKLIPNHRTARGDDSTGQRLEIVNHNGQSFLSPVAERERVNISSYGRWEQAFKVYSNVLTAKFPEKAPELLQYNHAIHSASTSFVWDNVYAYDQEFRHHISRHPYRSWSVILQQACTMLMKDRVRNDNSYFNKGTPKSKRDREPCRRFNKGRCTFGLSCKFDHRCSVKKCGKFGHGAHICHLRNTEGEGGKTGESSGSGAANTSKD